MYSLSGEEICDELKLYTNELEYFGPLFELHSNDPKTFWTKAQKHYKKLSDFAIAISKIPAVNRKVDLSKLITPEDYVRSDCGEVDENYIKNLLLN